MTAQNEEMLQEHMQTARRQSLFHPMFDHYPFFDRTDVSRAFRRLTIRVSDQLTRIARGSSVSPVHHPHPPPPSPPSPQPHRKDHGRKTVTGYYW